MPEIYAHVLTRTELRDLMAFLQNLKSTEEPPINDGPRALRTGLADDQGRGDEATLEEEESEGPAQEGGARTTAVGTITHRRRSMRPWPSRTTKSSSSTGAPSW